METDISQSPVHFVLKGRMNTPCGIEIYDVGLFTTKPDYVTCNKGDGPGMPTCIEIARAVHESDIREWDV